VLLRQDPRAVIDEALRHNSPTGFIFRTALKDFIYNGVEISKGELLCVLCEQAAKDPDVFSDPESFYSLEKAVEHQAYYLAFASPDTLPAPYAPRTPHHPCFGQYWARSILTAMLEGLEQLEGGHKTPLYKAPSSSRTLVARICDFLGGIWNKIF